MKIDKVLNNLPAELEKNNLYFLKENSRIRSFVTDNKTSNTIAYEPKLEDGQITVKALEEFSIDALITVGLNYEITNYDSAKTYEITSNDPYVIVYRDVDPNPAIFRITFPSEGTPGYISLTITATDSTRVISRVIDINPMNFAPSFNIMAFGYSVTNHLNINDQIFSSGRGSVLVDGGNKVLVYGIGYALNSNYSERLPFIAKYDLTNDEITPDTTFGTNGSLYIGFKHLTGDVAPEILDILETSTNEYVCVYSGFVLDDPNNTTVIYYRKLSNTGTQTAYVSLASVLDGENNVWYYSSFLDSQDRLYVIYHHSDSSNVTSIKRFNSNGDIDTTYGVNGKLMLFTSVDNTASTSFYFINKLTNGSFILVGESSNSNGDYSLAIAKLTSSGELDTSFGTNGLVETLSNTHYGYSCNIFNDVLYVPINDNNGNPGCERYNTTTGALIDSYVNTNYAGAYTNIVQDQNGKFILSGRLDSTVGFLPLIRLNSDFTVDSTFTYDSNDQYWIDFLFNAPNPSCKILKISTNKAIVHYYDKLQSPLEQPFYGFIRLNLDGSLDSTLQTTHPSIRNTYSITPTTPIAIGTDVYVSDVEADALNGGLGNYDGFKIRIDKENYDTWSQEPDLGAFFYLNPLSNYEFVTNANYSFNSNIYNVVVRKKSTNAIVAFVTLDEYFDLIENKLSILDLTFVNSPTKADITALLHSLMYVKNTVDSSLYYLSWKLTDSVSGYNLYAIGRVIIVISGTHYIPTDPYENVLDYCTDFDKYGKFTDGYGGVNDAIIETNSTFCGYISHVNEAPVLTLATEANYFPGENNIIDSDATLVDPELSLLTGIDPLNNPHSGVYGGVTITIDRINISNNAVIGGVNDHFLLTSDPLKGSTESLQNGLVGNVSSLMPSMPNYSPYVIGQISLDPEWNNSVQQYLTRSSFSITLNSNTYGNIVNNFLQSLTYKYNEVDTPNITLKITVDDGNTGSQGSGGAKSTSSTITLKPPTLLDEDIFSDTDNTHITDHISFGSNNWNTGYDLIEAEDPLNHSSNIGQYTIFNNKLYRYNNVNDLSFDNCIYSAILPNNNSEVIVEFEFVDVSNSITLLCFHRLTAVNITGLVIDKVVSAITIEPNGDYFAFCQSTDNSGITTNTSNNTMFALNGVHKLKSRLIGNKLTLIYRDIVVLEYVFDTSVDQIPLSGNCGFGFAIDTTTPAEFNQVSAVSFKLNNLV